MKNYLITGGAGGLATATIEELVKTDARVFALDLNAENVLKNEKVIAIQTDLTDNQSVISAKEKVLEYTDKLDVIINFAGIVKIGAVTEESVDVFKSIFDVNFFSMVRINKEFSPLLVDNQGRIINISSEYGVLDAVPFNIFYSATKRAVENYSDGLRLELMYRGIKVVKIRPGAFKTNMQGGMLKQYDDLYERTKSFKAILSKMKPIMTSELKKAGNTNKFKKVILKSINAKRPRLVYRVNNSLKMKLLSALPQRLQMTVYRLYFK